jgi:hypothetical protein
MGEPVLGYTARRRSFALLGTCCFILDMVRQLLIRQWVTCPRVGPTAARILFQRLPTVLRAEVGL